MLTKNEKTFKWMNWALIFLALGFLASPTIVSLFHILFAVPAILLIKREGFPKLPKSSIALLALVVWGAIATTYNFDTLVKPVKAYQELKFYLIGVLFIPGMIYYFKNASDHQLKRLTSIVSVVIIIAFFVGISKAWFSFDPVKMRFGDFHERSGGFTNYMRYGYASSFLALFGLNIFINRRGPFFKRYFNAKLFYIATVFCFLAIATSQTRGALLSLIVGFPFTIFFYRRKLALALFGVGGLFAAVVIYCSFINPGVTTSRFLNINQGSNSVRMSQFLTATKVIKEKPIFGLGGNQFSYNVKAYKEKYDIWAKKYEGHTHNIFLEHATSFGVLGAVLLALFFIFWGKEMLTLNGGVGIAVFSYIVAYVVAGQVENLFDNTNSHLLFFLYTFSQAWKFLDKSKTA